MLWVYNMHQPKMKSPALILSPAARRSMLCKSDATSPEFHWPWHPKRTAHSPSQQKCHEQIYANLCELNVNLENVESHLPTSISRIHVQVSGCNLEENKHYKGIQKKKRKTEKKNVLADLADRVVLATNPGGKMKINEAAYIFLGSPSKSHRAIGY